MHRCKNKRKDTMKKIERLLLQLITIGIDNTDVSLRTLQEKQHYKHKGMFSGLPVELVEHVVIQDVEKILKGERK